MLKMVEKVLYPPPPSFLMTSLCVLSFISMVNSGISEIRGKHIQHSKFWYKNNNNNKMKNMKMEEINLPSRTGMLVGYTPSFLLAAVSLWIFHQNDFRFMLVNSALLIHFSKRVLEVLFIHKYSGGMTRNTAVQILYSYFVATASMIYNQHLVQGIPEPQVDLKYAGVILFSVGTLGNFYHHCLLSKLRDDNNRGYNIPKGGLFGVVIYPHYLFEILVFVGVSFISQALYPLAFAAGSGMFLIGRSYATRRWYVARFTNFPKHVKALIPFVF